ncbi:MULTISPECIES: cytochrome P450 [Streptomycetaceae]|uniref:Cytochrome P450 n=1 Tax=Streptantibioticus cattleyicolor (strain ATCC 35852 / DSM 46488 / JCM 4925 / NBRC 14057 / NRRL 8057) TaxID=1003195 RepID=F8JSS2_STREN|nr:MULTISPECIES: cytochrome P450 [Streptomycetaceae]AEW97978.1 cytochrome P450 [Streptantibioticus cattleyicolor NRRL 8057 = DSM 46488]MYS62379.1 cytochrome P450 [Streptomyces sp. SID5468]CCB78296.1 putative Cytochrome P450 hydroxylase [Streptantibioticus cattleyicolor NRRL 8057 = DSM 46488]
MPPNTVPTPVPGGRPLIGHARQLLWRRLPFLESLRDHGDIVVIRLGPWRIHVLNDPALVRDVLTKRSPDFGLSPQFQVMKRVIGNGLLATDGPFHRRQRKLILPALHHTRIRAYARTMTRLADARTARWQDGQTLRVDAEFTELATEIVLRCLFSTEIGGADVAAVVAALPDLMSWAGSRGLDPTGLLGAVPTPLGRRFRRSMAVLDALLARVIGARRADGPATDHPDLLAALLAARDAETGEPMSDRQIRDEAMSFLVAGAESVSRTLTWSALLLAGDPEAARRLHQEADRELSGRPAHFEDLPRLRHTRMVLQEALRLYPPGYLISRAALRDTTLGPYRIPAGATVMFSYYALQRDPRRFPDPARFDPLRWSPKRGGADREAFTPFGLGPHGCLGESFAWTEMSIVLATLAARWELRSASPRPVRPVPTFSLTMAGAPMTVTARPVRTGPVHTLLASRNGG